MNLAEHLAQIEERARIALAVDDGTATDDERTSLPTMDDVTPEQAAYAFLLGGYALTPAPGSPVIAVLSVGAPNVQIIRDGDRYALTAYAPGHADTELWSETVTRWGRMIAQETNR